MTVVLRSTRLRPQCRSAEKHTPRCSRRNNGPMQAATRAPGAPVGVPTPRGLRPFARAGAAVGARPRAMRALGRLGLAGILASVFLVAAGAATRPTSLVPARSGGWPGWMAGPFRGLDVGLSRGSFQAYTLLMCASYLLVLACARRLRPGAIAATILTAHVILLLGPPLISQDVFGYVGYA